MRFGGLLNCPRCIVDSSTETQTEPVFAIENVKTLLAYLFGKKKDIVSVA